MPKGIRPHLTFANVASALALFMAIGGGAVAVGAVSDSDGTIKACYVKKGKPKQGTATGEVQLLLKGKKCGKGEQEFSFNEKGPQGPAGAPGPQGLAGATGPAGSARAYGKVSPDGVLDVTRSSPGVTVTHNLSSFPGEYCITLASGVNQHITNIIPTPAMEYGSASRTGSVGAGLGGCIGFRVETYNSSGNPANVGFNFMIP